VWDLSRPEAEPQVLRGHQNYVLSVAWEPDGRRLASGSGDGTVRVWRIAAKDLIPIACRRAGRNLSWNEYERYLEKAMPLRTCEQWPVHQSVTAEAERLARQDRVEAAITLLRRAKDEQPDLDLDPETYARLAALKGRVDRSADLLERDVTRAFSELHKVLEICPDLNVSAHVWRRFCRSGALSGRVADAMQFCGKALKADSDDVEALLGHGLALAQRGDLTAALSDFERVHADLVKNRADPELPALLTAWIDALKTGRNPIDTVALEHLRDLRRTNRP
jgi:tetratricopeptide (TPR) repeat protein